MSQGLEVLVRRVKNGEASAFQTIYEILGKKIYNFVYRMLGSREEAEDIAQDTFLIAYRELKVLRNDEQFEAWIYRIARNQVYQKLRHGKYLRYTLDDEQGQDARELKSRHAGVNPEQDLLKTELNRNIQIALSHLPDNLREVFVLAVIQRVPYKEICEIVGKSLSAVKTDIYRARLLARDELKKYLHGRND